MYFSSIDPSSFRPRSLICTLRRPRASGGVCSNECTAIIVQDSSTSLLLVSFAASSTTPTGGFLSQTARYYDADLFAIDVKRIERWYNRKGYYDAKVKDVQEKKDDMGRVTLVVTIEEGKRAKVDQVEIHGLSGLPS